MDTGAIEDRPPDASRYRWLGQIVTVLLLAAVAELGVLLATAGWQAAALSNQLASLRAAAGHLDVYDRSKVYAVRINSRKPNEWAWRIYLPGNHTYVIYNYRGRMPELQDPVDPDRQRQTYFGTGSRGAIQSGEFVLRFRVEERSDRQWETKVITQSGFGSVAAAPHGTWLADRDWRESSAIPAAAQREFSADATFDLIRLRKNPPLIPMTPNAERKRSCCGFREVRRPIDVCPLRHARHLRN